MRKALPVVIGLLLLALFVWFAGPYFAFADYHPLESILARLILILLIVLVWAGSVAYRKFKARRASDKLVAAVVAQSTTEDRPSAEARQLRERFEESVAMLKQQRRGGHTLYDLPWYAIIGAPGSGKTTALVNSGLHFPLEQRSGRALKGIGGTRNCDWWFTDEAVLLDTAGRYVTQDSDAAADSAGWAEFLALLRKYRRRRPLNGVLLSISAQDLMQGTTGLEAHIDAMKRRLSELNRELRVQLPVYVLVTKTDLVSGFSEYFDDLTADGRAQVWGVTFPYDQTVSGQAAQTFELEYDRLLARLNQRVFARVEDDNDVQRRTKAFGFPQQMAALRETLTQFVNGVFAPNRFDQSVLLRGVYFTSGTQEGTPIDRILGALGRRFGMPADAAVPGGRGKAYFIERFLKDVLLGESGLAGVSRRFELQLAAAQIALYVTMAVIAIVGVILVTVSFARNRAYVSEVGTTTASLEQTAPVPTTAPLDDQLPRLDAVRRVSDVANRFGNAVPWSMRWGLFQGRSLGDAARDAYARELDGALLPHIATRFRDRLIQYAPQPERLYPYLKAYLMLGSPEHLQKQQLEYLASLDWQEAYASNPDRAAVLSQHLHNLLDSKTSLRPMVLDEQIVAQARSTLKQASLPGLIYRYVRINYANDTARSLRLDIASGLGSERVLMRKGAKLSDPVPSIYLAPVFKEITAKGTDALVRQFASEAWVWGDSGPKVTSTADLTAEFVRVYEDDYIATWDRLVADIQAVPLTSLDGAKEALAILGGGTSPLRGFLKVVDENTYFVPPQEPAKKDGGGFGLPNIPDVFSRGKALVAPAVMPGARITEHFAAIHRLVAGDKGTAPIDGVIGKLGALQQKVQSVGTKVGEIQPGSPQAVSAVSTAVVEINRDAQALPPGIANVVTRVTDGTAAAVRGGARNDLMTRYQQSVVGPCNDIARGKYPFVPVSAQDVTPSDFGRLFAAGGIYDAFFRTEMAPLVVAGRTPLTWNSDATGASVGGTPQMLTRFESAQRIRDVFFASGQEPQLRFTLTPVELDAGAQRFTLEVDGQSLEYRHAAPRPVPMQWPGPKPNLVVATFEERAGGRPNVVFEGPWAWLRFLDVAKPMPDAGSEVRFTLTIGTGGHEAKLLLEVPSRMNPYRQRDVLQFRCE